MALRELMLHAKSPNEFLMEPGFCSHLERHNLWPLVADDLRVLRHALFIDGENNLVLWVTPLRTEGPDTKLDS
jgi:hypothetical protein